MFFTKGVGRHKGLSAIIRVVALRNAGIGKCNLVTVSVFTLEMQACFACRWNQIS